MVRTTLPKVDKEGTPSAEVPMAQALVARPESKAPDDNLVDDDPDLLNFTVAEIEIICQMSPGCRCVGLTQGNWTIMFGIPDGLVFTSLDVGPTFLVFRHENVEGGLWALLWLAFLILLSLATFRTFWLVHLRWPLFSYDDILALG
jgi:hypothetical protein